MTAIDSSADHGDATVSAYGEVTDPLRILWQIGDAIAQEIVRQDEKWGIQDHSLGDWWLIVGEEDGEAAAAILQGRFSVAECELIHAITVRVRMIEKLRRMV